MLPNRPNSGLNNGGKEKCLNLQHLELKLQSKLVGFQPTHISLLQTVFKTKVLILTANPTNTAPLRLSDEVREIKASWERSPQRDRFEIIVEEAIHSQDLRRTVLNHKPQILHFSGHGGGEQGLVLLDKNEQALMVPPEALTRFFKALQDIFHLDCVVLNACYSEVQANGIFPYVDFVVGMNREVGDRAARQFAIGFYDTIFAGEKIESAFALGCNAIELENIPEHLTPVLKCRNATPTIAAQKSTMTSQTGSRVQQLRNDRLQRELDQLAEEYQAVADQLALTLNPTDEVRLKRQLAQLETQMQAIEAQALEAVRQSETMPGDQIPTVPAVSTEVVWGTQILNIPLENLDGSVPLGSPFYVDRPPVEQLCYATIQKEAGLVRIKAPRQMGKTSLICRTLAEGERLGYRSALINLWDRKFLTDIETFLENFCATLSDALDIEEKIDSYWKKRLGSQQNCSNYLQKYLLKEISTPIVVGLDEVDRIFEYLPLAHDFFGLLRSWHERGKNDPIWQKLRLVISHSQEVYIPLNVNQSPFNVGVPIDLGEFSPAQVQDLADRHGLQFAATDFQRLLTLLGGHPYLVRVTFYQLAKHNLSLEQLFSLGPTEEGPFSDHLYRHLLLLEDNPRLKIAMKTLIRSDRPLKLDAIDSFKLKSMGLVKAVGNELLPLCQLYRLYFSDRLAG